MVEKYMYILTYPMNNMLPIDKYNQPQFNSSISILQKIKTSILLHLALVG